MMKFLKLSELKCIGRRKDEEFRYNCPFCKERKGTPDTKGHLYVNKSLGIYHCFRCNASLKTTGVPLLYDSSKLSRRSKTPLQEIVSLPLDYHPLFESVSDFFPVFWKYALKRGIVDEDIYKYNIGFTTDLDSPFFGRLIFCYLENESLLFYQGRWILNSDNPCKYLSCGEKPLFKSFEGSVKKGIIVEGIFDMVKASRFVPSAAILGHSISYKQSIRIASSFTDKVVLALDADASREIVACLKMIKGPQVEPIFLKSKDISEMNDNQIEALTRKLI